ncbi:substrate-binding periplasmic protein [Sporohalobacter salinus]|uniref:substrate-binding periplasmic protein n=1 Tax=Sporohalobacter salinus TaxID=1494606 RepID=UPI0019617341|nr:ABC transporter substrate-binding protein [Sporohalobacter salinus]MBM7623908.1 polar amino acid transport system substrate-binding protein [Sporohalobacter salinus]
MLKKFGKLSCLALILALLFSFGTYAKSLTIITENYPPLNYKEQGKITGPSVEIVREIQKRVGSNSKIKLYPWTRGYNMALNKANVALFSTTRTKKRENKFKWVGPIAEMKSVFFAKKGSNIEINSLQDAKQVNTIGTLMGDATEQTLEKKGFTNYSGVSKNSLNLKKLLAGRIDLWYTRAINAKEFCKKAGVDFDKLEPVYTVKSPELYIAFNKNTPDTIINKWEKAYEELRKEGFIKKVLKKYNYSILYPTEDK